MKTPLCADNYWRAVSMGKLLDGYSVLRRATRARRNVEQGPRLWGCDRAGAREDRAETRRALSRVLHELSRLATCIIIVLLSIGMLTTPLHCRAHAIVLKSSLSTHPIRSGVAESITLYFNSRIEVKLSRAVLLSRDPGERALAMVSGQAPGEVVVKLPLLEPGDYAVRYRVLAADGHITEATIRFSVAR